MIRIHYLVFSLYTRISVKIQKSIGTFANFDRQNFLDTHGIICLISVSVNVDPSLVSFIPFERENTLRVDWRVN